MTINFPALGGTPVEVEHYLPSTIDLRDGTTRPYGIGVNGTVFVSRATFAQLETGNLDLVVQDLGTISLEPSIFNFSDTKTQPYPEPYPTIIYDTNAKTYFAPDGSIDYPAWTSITDQLTQHLTASIKF